MWSWINCECIADIFFSLKKNQTLLCGNLYWRTTSWKQTAEPPSAPALKRRRRTSPGPVIVIKDEPEDDDEVRFVRVEFINLGYLQICHFDPNVLFLQRIKNWSLTYYRPIFKKGGYSFWNINRLWIRDKVENQHRMLVTTQYYKYSVYLYSIQTGKSVVKITASDWQLTENYCWYPDNAKGKSCMQRKYK